MPLRIASAILLAAALHPHAEAQAAPSGATMTQVSHSVIQVLSRQCPGGSSRTGSGFLWGDSQQAVTDLHVVVGCKQIVAHFTADGDIVATPVRQLLNSDLVLLKLERKATAPPLQVSPSEPAINDNLEAIGYYYGVPTLDNRRLSVTIGSNILNDMLPKTLSDQVRAAGSPDLNVHIIRLDGHLLPGLSGAPVINTAGRVVGIGSGGLADGAAGVSWAINSSYLKDLPNGQPFQAVSGRQATRPSAFFSMEEGFTAEGNGSKCGDLDFIHLRSSTVGELRQTTEDSRGFFQLASTSGLSGSVIDAIPLDTYVNPASGGSIAIPAGATLTNTPDGMCEVSLDGGKYKMWIVSARAESLEQKNAIAQSWQVTWSQKFGYRWILNPSYSYVAPLRRQDGLIVNRKLFAGYKGLLVKGEAFETVMTRGDSVIGVMVMNSDFNTVAYSTCNANPGRPGCQQISADYRIWASAFASTFLATFPPQ